jgi:hypothetical protein
MDSGCGNRNRHCPCMLAGPARRFRRHRILGCDSAAALRRHHFPSEPATASGRGLRRSYTRCAAAARILPAAASFSTRLAHSKWSSCARLLKRSCGCDPVIREVLTAIGEGAYACRCSLCFEPVDGRPVCGDGCDTCPLPDTAGALVARDAGGTTLWVTTVRRRAGNGISLPSVLLGAKFGPCDRG